MLTVFKILEMILVYFTEGYALADSHMMIVKGVLEREFCFISYKKMQYVKFQQNLPARLSGLMEANIYLLASRDNRKQDVPYFEVNEAEKIKEKILKA